MTELTMDDLAKRLAELEHQVALLSGKFPASKDWRRSVGMFEGSEFMSQVDADVLAAREAEREQARAGNTE
jgi:hypothetical protein